MISLSKLSNKSNVNVNVNPSVNVNVGNSKTTEATVSDVPASYPDNANASSVGDSTDYKALYEKEHNLCEVLTLLIDMIQHNPLISNGYIIADDEKLMKFVQLLTGADDVQIDAEDLGQGCISKKLFRKIHAIYVIKNNETKNLKYDYPNVMKELKDLAISTKFIW